MRKIPTNWFRRLSRDHRLKVFRLIQNFQKFNKQAILILDQLAYYFPTHPFKGKPLKLFYLHGLTTMGTLALMPPAGETPAIAIPIVFASSFCVAYILSAFI